MNDAEKFTIAAKEDPILAIVVPQSRRKVARDKTLPMGARVMYDFLTDYSLWKEKCPLRGVVTMPNGDLARHLGISIRSVQNYKSLLRSRGAIFTSEKFLRNAWPATVYYITAIVGQEQLPGMEDFEEGRLADDDSVIRSNRRRMQPRFRDQKGKWLKAFGIQDDTNQNLPATHANGCVPGTHHDACQNGNGLRAGHATDCLPRTLEIADMARSHLRAGHAAICVPGTKQDADKGGATDVSIKSSVAPFKRSTVGNASKKAGRAKKITAENAFLADVAWIMDIWKPAHGKFELENSGAWWRQCYRSEADLIARVLAETKCMIHEGKIKTTPGQVAVDLWKRWNLDRLRAAWKKEKLTDGRRPDKQPSK
jgi:hypothetical protein